MRLILTVVWETHGEELNAASTARSGGIFMMHRRESVLFCRTDSEELLEKN